MEDVVRVLHGVQYDGTNSAEIVSCIGAVWDWSLNNAQLHSASIVSETAGILTLRFDPGEAGPPAYNVTINEGDWVLTPPNPGTQGEITTDVARLSTLVNP